MIECLLMFAGMIAGMIAGMNYEYFSNKSYFFTRYQVTNQYNGIGLDTDVLHGSCGFV